MTSPSFLLPDGGRPGDVRGGHSLNLSPAEKAALRRALLSPEEAAKADQADREARDRQRAQLGADVARIEHERDTALGAKRKRKDDTAARVTTLREQLAIAETEADAAARDHDETEAAFAARLRTPHQQLQRLNVRHTARGWQALHAFHGGLSQRPSLGGHRLFDWAGREREQLAARVTGELQRLEVSALSEADLTAAVTRTVEQLEQDAEAIDDRVRSVLNAQQEAAEREARERHPLNRLLHRVTGGNG